MRPVRHGRTGRVCRASPISGIPEIPDPVLQRQAGAHHGQEGGDVASIVSSLPMRPRMPEGRDPLLYGMSLKEPCTGWPLQS